jgi:hypothetical protein
LENENNILTNEISKTKAKLEEVTKTLGFIQLRDKAKNFLKSFNIKLDNRDEEAIKQKKNKVKIEYYEKNINRFFQENNIIIMNPIKI